MQIDDMDFALIVFDPVDKISIIATTSYNLAYMDLTRATFKGAKYWPNSEE